MLLEEINGRTNDWYVPLSQTKFLEDPIYYPKEIATIHFTFDSNVIIDGFTFITGCGGDPYTIGSDPKMATAYFVDETTNKEVTFFDRFLDIAPRDNCERQ